MMQYLINWNILLIIFSYGINAVRVLPDLTLGLLVPCSGMQATTYSWGLNCSNGLVPLPCYMLQNESFGSFYKNHVSVFNDFYIAVKVFFRFALLFTSGGVHLSMHPNS